MSLFWIYVPLIAAAFVWNLGAPAATYVLCVAAGIALWTPIEYLMHRIVLHRMAPHYDHHNEPAVAAYIFAPLTLSGGAAAVLYLLLIAATGSAQRAALVEAGTVAGYLFYEALHVRIHSNAAGGPLLRFWRRHHYYHHFADHTRCYGVTTPLWDYIFRTPRAPGRESAYDRPNSHGAGDLDVRPPGTSQAG